MTSVATHSRGMRRPARFSGPAGFTLIEVIIAMVIIAILAAIAIPAYTQYIARGHRSEARSTLMQAAQWMERWRTQRGTYVGAVLPGPFGQSPPPPGTARYGITLGGLAANTYTLTATPQGTMAGDVCGNFSLDQSGQRAHSGSGSAELCWGR